MSSTIGRADLEQFKVVLAKLAKACEDFASDISLEAADNLSLAHSFPGPASHVFLGPGIITKPDHHDAVKSGIGLAVAAAVEPMPGWFSRTKQVSD